MNKDIPKAQKAIDDIKMLFPKSYNNKALMDRHGASNIPNDMKTPFDENPKFSSEEFIQEALGASIPEELWNKLNLLGLIPNDVRASNEGSSNYAKHFIQPWSIWLDYPNLTPWDHDIIKRVLRDKATDSRKLDYEKIIHICNERIRQINLGEN